MTRADDYPSDMDELLPRPRTPLDERAMAGLLGAHPRSASADLLEVATVLTELRAVVEQPPPAPSAALAAMLRDGIAVVPAPVDRPARTSSPLRRRVRRTVLVAGLSSLISVPLMGVAAAADRLPDAAQHVVAQVIKATTPFTVADPGPAGSTSTEQQAPSVTKKKAGNRPDAPAGVHPSDAAGQASDEVTDDPTAPKADVGTAPAETGLPEAGTAAPIEESTDEPTGEAGTDPGTSPTPDVTTPAESPSPTDSAPTDPTTSSPEPSPSGQLAPVTEAPKRTKQNRTDGSSADVSDDGTTTDTTGDGGTDTTTTSDSTTTTDTSESTTGDTTTSGSQSPGRSGLARSRQL